MRCRSGRATGGPIRPLAHELRGSSTFYGFVAAETNQYYPSLWEGTTPVQPPTTPQEGYHLTEDLADPRDRLGAPTPGDDP